MNAAVADDRARSLFDCPRLRNAEQPKFAVLANPMRRCGVHLTAKQQAMILQCPLILNPELANEFDFVYLHWHPNFEWQHPTFAKALMSIETKTVLIVHDFAFTIPVKNPVLFFAFDARSVPSLNPIQIPMPLQEPFPFVPNTEPNDDVVGFFGFYGQNKGVWTVLNYAMHHRKTAKFITTLHPFAPPWVAAEFSEFVSTAKRLGMKVITDWLEGQELANEMGECSFFVILHKSSGYGASASVCSVLAAQRPVFADKSVDFLKAAKEFIMQFDPNRWPTLDELEQAGTLVSKKAQAVLSPYRIWNEVHSKTLALIYS